jgi:hypothetical protein
MTHTDESAPVARLSAFLATDPRDVGCERAMEILHVYVDLVAAGEDIGRFIGVTTHLRACGPCSDEFEGLLAVVVDDAGGPQPPTGT